MRSLEDLQQAMQERLAQEGLATAPTVPVRRDPARAPLSFGQRYVWAHQQLSPDSTAYNLCLLLTFRGQVDVAALRTAFEALVRRHEVLRTTYHCDDDGEPYQRIHDDLTARLAELDLTGAADAAARVHELAHAAAREPFDLTRESSLRVTFVRVHATEVVAVLVIQHIAWDGMTLPALAQDVQRFYGQARTGPVEFEPLRLQVADFAEWEQERFRTDDRAADIAFWQSRFDGDPPELSLPYDRRPLGPALHGARSDRPLGDRADAALRRLSAALSTTPFSVFLAAYYLALRQLTGQHDMVVGTTVANREESGQELLIGNFSNVLPLRLAAGSVGTFAELVAHVGEVTTEAFRHKTFPQEAIARAVHRATGHAGSQLFDTMVLFLHQRIDGPQLPDAATSWELIDHGAALLPIVCETFMHADRTEVQLTYRTDLFDPATVDRLHEYIDRMLAAATESVPVERLLTLSAADAERLHTWSHGPAVPIAPETTDAMIRAAAASHPERIAVVFDDIELTYAEFDAQVNRLARLLLEHGVRPGDHVGVLAERSEWLPITFAAVLRVAAVYVPIDPGYPADRIEYLLADSEPAVLVRSVSSVPVPDVVTDMPVIDLGDAATGARLAGLAGSPLGADELARSPQPLDAAYLLYTSGTTGRPKGVVIDHLGIASHAQWFRGRPGFDAERVLQKAPIGFDVSVGELVVALCNGGTSVLPPPQWWQADVESLVGIVERHRVTQMSLVPSALRAFLDARPDPRRLESLRWLYLGGESVPPALVAETRRVFGCTVMGLYGPTEATMDLTCEEFLDIGDDADGPATALIGVPEWNSSVYVLDERLRQVAPGVVGELYLGGVQLARGYHRRPDLTAGAFVACPFGTDPGERMYRTGDIVRWNARGRLEYLGRSDDQVKIRGHRIELGEIGTVLRAMPGIASAAAVAVPHAGGPILAAYYVPEPDSDFATTADEAAETRIKEHLAVRLPEYMVPAALVRLDALPLTANGKLDRKALPDPDLGGGTARGRALREGPEQAVAAAVRQVLGLGDTTELGADDDFLALGGDSITAIRMVSALKKHSLIITTSALFEARTIARIAAATAPLNEVDAPALVDGDGTGWIPLNPIATMVTEQAVEYRGFSQSTAVVTPEGCTRERVSAVLRALLDRHPLLRARVVPGPDGRLAYYVPASGEPVAYPGVDEVVLDAAEWDAVAPGELQRRMRGAARELDASAGRMVGAVWVRSSDGARGRLVLVIDHMVVDGVSWRIINDDLRQLWAAVRAAEPGAARVLPADGTSVRAWNTAVAELADSDRVRESLPYWRSAAAGPDPLLGERALDPAIDTVATVRELTAELGAADTAVLMTTATRAFGCDFLDIQVAALAVAVHRFRHRRGTDADTVSLTMERHGRVENLFAGADLANTVGWFTTAYPVSLDVGAADVESAVRAVKEQLLAVPDSGIGWGLLRWLNPRTRAELAAHRAPQIALNYMGRFAVAGAAEVAGEWDAAPEFGYLGGYADDAMPAPALIDINTVAVTDDDAAALHASFRFASGVLSEAAVRELAESWMEALRELAKTVRENPIRRLTPSDVLARDVGQLDLDRWRALYGEYADVYPLSPMQSGLYFTALSTAGRDLYLVQTMITVRGPLDAPRLVRSIDTVLNRYPNLRVSISVSHAGRPYAIVAEHMEIPHRELDFSDLPDARDRLQQFVTADLADQFDLSRGPLMRSALIHLPGDEHVVMLTTHHVLTDGWSGQVLPRELFAAYATDGTAPPSGDPDTFAKFLLQTAAREAEAEAAWDDYLSRVRPCVVAPGRESGDGGVPAARGAELEPAMVDTLTALAAELGTTFNVVCQLAWGSVLCQLTGTGASVFGEVVSGRPADLDDVDTAVGCFVNTVPVAVDLDPARSWREVLAEMQQHRLELMEYHQFPLTSAIRATGARKLFDTMYVLQSYPSGRDEMVEQLRSAGLELVEVAPGGATDNALLLMVFPANSLLPGDRVRVMVFYDESAFEPDDARIVETAFLTTLQSIAADPDRRIGEVRVLDDDDQAVLVMRRMWQ
ncbi:non-ribosomal peptide synthetase [Nocardia wallacei]|uniref:non-ribosomal peptide synthetase n=1 Tax=Nocardia wallacei TaxID=480035 RepID=UPI0024587E8E|nr:non-ribosomal peptide synthetase [Nocardia wallacei]